MKTCSKCGIEKALFEFSKQSASKDGLQCWCKSCYTDVAVQHSVANPGAANRRTRKYKQKLGPERRRLAQLKCRHGITAEELSNRMAAQSGCCAICKDPFSSSFKTHIDHIHDTNPRIIRGILCNLCNTGLGLFKDSPERLANAIEYLKKFQK